MSTSLYGKSTGPTPSSSLFPRDARDMIAGMMWVFESTSTVEQSAQIQKAGDTIQGIAASPGNYRGPVRVILNEGQFSKIQAGEVLVYPTNSPVWSMVFPSIGALVTDSGGILSHPAIIASEYRVPTNNETASAVNDSSDLCVAFLTSTYEPAIIAAESIA